MPSRRPAPAPSVDELRSFVACADAGSFSAAAARVHRTQSTVSGQIARLEAMFGGELFVRTPRGVVLSDAGRTLLAYARRMLALQDEMADAFSGRETEGELRLGFSEYVLPGRVAELIAVLAQRFPRLALQASVDTSARLHALLDRGALDVLVGTAIPGARPAGRAVAEEPLAWVARERLRFAPGATVPLVLLEPACAVHRHAVACLERARFTPRVVFAASSVLGVHAAVAAGLGIGCLNRGATPAALLRLGRTSGLPDPGRLQVYVSATATPAGSRVSEVLAAVLGAARRDAAPARGRRSEVA